MTGATLARANRAIEKAGIPVELVRGEGYHYFVYDNPERNVYDTISVMVPYTNMCPVEWWVKEAEDAYEKIIADYNRPLV